MKLLIQNTRIVATATDDYTGPDAYITAPDDYDPAQDYRVIDGVLVPQVPESVTQRQARLMLHRQGVLAGVDAVIDAMPEPQKTEARIEWEYASAILRSSPLVAAMGAALGLDEAGLDLLFVEAAKL